MMLFETRCFGTRSRTNVGEICGRWVDMESHCNYAASLRLLPTTVVLVSHNVAVLILRVVMGVSLVACHAVTMMMMAVEFAGLVFEIFVS